MHTIAQDEFCIKTSEDTFTYLMRDDTHSVIRNFTERARLALVEFTPQMVCDLEGAYQNFIERLTDAYLEHSGSRQTVLHIVDAQTVNKCRNEKIQNFIESRHMDFLVVTMDPLCDFPDTIPFAVSRLFDIEGITSTKLTNRPGNDTIAHQINKIHEQAHGKGIILVEDDLFSGSTIQRTLDLLTGESLNGSNGDHIEVVALFPGIQAINDQPLQIEKPLFIDPVFRVEIPSGSLTEDVLDIGDPRDFLVGGDGLVTTAGRMPYLLPFVSPSARASVPSHLEELFSQTLLELTGQFYKDAEKITGEIWPVTFCESASQEGLKHHKLVNNKQLKTKSMVDITESALELLELNRNARQSLAD